MSIVGVDAAGADEADDVETTVRLGCPVAGGNQCRAFEERTIGDRRVDPRQVLEHRPARSQIQVADLGVAHLARRQPDGILRGAQDRVGPALEEPPPDGHRGCGDRIGRGVAPHAEAVEDHEDDRPRPRQRGARHGFGHEAAVTRR